MVTISPEPTDNQTDPAQNAASCNETSPAMAWAEGWAACSEWWHANAAGTSDARVALNPYLQTDGPEHTKTAANCTLPGASGWPISSGLVCRHPDCRVASGPTPGGV